MNRHIHAEQIQKKPYILRAEIAQQSVGFEVRQYGQWEGAYCLDAPQHFPGGSTYSGGRKKHIYPTLVSREDA